MIFRRRQLRLNNGYSIIELIITVSIISILTSIVLPTYQYFVNRKKQLEFESMCMIIQDDFMMALSNEEMGFKNYYPFYGDEHNQTVGYNNLPILKILNLCMALINNCHQLSDNNPIITSSYNETEFHNNIAYLYYQFILKDNTKLVFTIEIHDSLVNYVDYGIIKECEYTNKDSLTKLIKL